MRSHHLVAARVESPGVGWSRAREIRRRGEPPGRGGSVKFKNCFMSLPPKTRQNLILAPGPPNPLNDVASFGNDPPVGDRSPGAIGASGHAESVGSVPI